MLFYTSKANILQSVVPYELKNEPKWIIVNIDPSISEYEKLKILGTKDFQSKKRYSFDEIIQKCLFREYGEIVFVGSTLCHIVEIVILDCFSPDNGELDPWIKEIISQSTRIPNFWQITAEFVFLSGRRSKSLFAWIISI